VLKNINGKWIDEGGANSSSKLGDFHRFKRRQESELEHINKKLRRDSNTSNEKYIEALNRKYKRRPGHKLEQSKTDKKIKIELSQKFI